MRTPITVEFTDVDYSTKREDFYTYGEVMDFVTTYGAMTSAEILPSSDKLYMEV